MRKCRIGFSCKLPLIFIIIFGTFNISIDGVKRVFQFFCIYEEAIFLSLNCFTQSGNCFI